MRSLALQSAVVAAVAVGAIGGAPVDDEAQTNNHAAISIPVLINDPTGIVLEGVVDPTSGATVSSATLDGGATVTVVGDQIRYSPNGNLPTDGSDSFSYVTDCGEANVVVAVTPGANGDGTQSTTAPNDDTAVTRPNSAVRIDVLLNDPQFSVITAVAGGAAPPVTLPSGATVTFTPDDPLSLDPVGSGALTYTPAPGAGTTSDVTDTFQYSTQGGPASVTVRISTSAPIPSVGPIDDLALTDFETPVRIDVLGNDPPGTKLLGVEDPSLGRPDNGSAAIRGNYIVFTPDPDRPDNPAYDVVFEYKTNGGTGRVTVNVGGINQGLAQGQIRIFNATRFNLRISLPGQPGVFFESCNTGQPRSTQTIGAGDPLADPPVENVEPMSGETLCVALLSGTIDEFEVQAEIVGSTASITTSTECPIEALPNGTERALIVREVVNFFGTVVDLAIECPFTPGGGGTPTP